MSVRLGIELSPSACRIVEIDGSRHGGRAPGETRVRSFAVLPPYGAELRTPLAALRGRSASVVVWNAPSEHRQVMVTGGSYEAMRHEAIAALDAAGLQTHGVADIAPVLGAVRRGVRQSVVVAVASTAELTQALEPLRAAGITPRVVMTPAVALASLARQRRSSSVPGAVEAYAALEPTATCVALVRDAALVAARTLPWGYRERATGRTRDRDEVASRLAETVTDFVRSIGGETRELGQVCVCGPVPELRTMTLPLMERLDVEVEPLDSLFGIDASAVPPPANEFRDRVVELRLAWAAVADWPPSINLLRSQRRRTSRAVLIRTAVAAGVAAGVGAGWAVQRSAFWRGPSPTQSAQSRGRTAAAPANARATAPFVPPPDVGPALPSAIANSRRPLVPPPDSGPTIPAEIARQRASAAIAPTSSPQVPPVAASVRSAPAPAAVAQVAQSPRMSPSQSAPLDPARMAGARPEPPPPVLTPRSAARSTAPAESSPPRAHVTPRDKPTEAATPFDASLGTILVSADRKLAIIDGRIVGIGDRVRDARITDITTDAVWLRDAQGRLRHLTLGTSIGR